MSHAKEKFHPNKELFGQGLATMIASLFGGQPATGAIARTSVNIHEQLRSTWQEVTTYVLTAIVTIAVDLIWAIFVGILLHFVLKISINFSK